VNPHGAKVEHSQRWGVKEWTRARMRGSKATGREGCRKKFPDFKDYPSERGK